MESETTSQKLLPECGLFNLNKHNHLIISGNASCIDVINYFKPIIKSCQDISAWNFRLLIWLENMNAAASKQIVRLLYCIQRNKSIQQTQVSWYIHTDNEDLYDRAVLISELFGKITFQFKHIPVLVVRS